MRAPRLVIIGATGWYGRILLHEYCMTYGEDSARKNLLLTASKACQVSIKINGSINTFDVHALENIASLDLSSYETLFWYAFVLKNQIDILGPIVWGQKNEKIASQVFNLLKIAPNLRTIYFSSGAALGHELTPEYDVDPYANLKIRYEEQLKSITDCIVVYPYATSGMYINNIEAFALSSFIFQSMNGRVINIKADFPVVRSYSSAHDFSRLLLKFSEQDRWGGLVKRIVPVTHTLELQQLANEVIDALNLNIPVTRPKLSAGKKPSIYVADSFEFPALMADWGLASKSLADQIREMAADILAK